MYLTLGTLAIAVVLYAAVSGRVDGSRISGPIAVVVFGVCLGPAGSNLLRLDLTRADLRLLVELTLALVLFCDAANADVAQVRRARFLPRRLLFVGLPSTIALGYVVGVNVARITGHGTTRMIWVGAA